MLVVLVACVATTEAPSRRADSGDTADAGGDTADSSLGRDAFIDTTNVFEGDASCVGEAVQAPMPSRQVPVDVRYTLFDAEESPDETDAEVEVFLTDDPTHGADVTVKVDDAVTLEIPTCAPLAFRTTSRPSRAMVPTLEVHVIEPFADDERSRVLLNLSESDVDLLAGDAGVVTSDEHGMVFGAAADCAGESALHAQVFLHDGTGAAPAGSAIAYAEDYELSQTQGDMGEQALFLASGLPAGWWTADLYAFDGVDHVLLGSTSVPVEAGGITLLGIEAGPGTRYPDDCLD